MSSTSFFRCLTTAGSQTVRAEPLTSRIRFSSSPPTSAPISSSTASVLTAISQKTRAKRSRLCSNAASDRNSSTVLTRLYSINPLPAENIKGIVDLLVAELAKRLCHDRQIKRTSPPRQRTDIISNGYDPDLRCPPSQEIHSVKGRNPRRKEDNIRRHRPRFNNNR